MYDAEELDRIYSKLYSACRKAYNGGGMYGLDLHTVNVGWRRAFRRIATYKEELS